MDLLGTNKDGADRTLPVLEESGCRKASCRPTSCRASRRSSDMIRPLSRQDVEHPRDSQTEPLYDRFICAAHRPCAFASAIRPSGRAVSARVHYEVWQADSHYSCRVPRTAVLFTAAGSLWTRRTGVNSPKLPATSPPAVSRAAVSNAAPSWLGKLRSRATRVNLSRRPRRLSRGNCRVLQQPPRRVAGTSAFLFAQRASRRKRDTRGPR